MTHAAAAHPALPAALQAHLDLPMYDEGHRALAQSLWQWAQALPPVNHDDTDHACQQLVRQLGEAGFLRYCVPAAYGGALPELDSRALCLIREILGWHDGLADFAFAMQGLGTGAISLAGTHAHKQAILPRVARGEWISAFALTEPLAGSDVGAMQCEARLEGDHYVITGEKTWISNGGIADVYCLFARTGEAPGARGISAFIITPDMPGFEVAERLEVMAPHPLARLRFNGMRVPLSQRLGAPGEGFKIAMRTLDIFRASVAAAALGFARRALHESVLHARARSMFGQHLADFQLTQARLGEMATDLEAAALLTVRAAWQRDVLQRPATREAAMAKMTATEHAQRIIDAAVQLQGGQGVRRGNIVESLYREIRALRIYEGATEVQKLIIGRDLLKSHD
ncbi:MAG: acyl-CoA dehydrogenase [Limnohabitans sp.]|nr:acyl-CoA dehydrogenase [Limnohabitans sp.]